MEFRSLKSQYQAYKQEIDSAIAEVISEANFISGNQVSQLEQELAQFTGARYCISCANGTDALSLALMAWGIKAGDAVFVPDFTFFASGEVVSFSGAHPVFVDVEENTYNIDPEKLESAIDRVIREGKYTPKAVVAVDLFGQPADYPRLRRIVDKYGLKLLEDGAQGFGGEIEGRKACSFGDLSTTSFFPMKPLGCYGDGGALFTDDEEMAGLLRSLRIHGKGSYKYDNIRIGMNSRLDTIQAAILKVKLKAFQNGELEAVNNVAGLYHKELEGVVLTPEIRHGFYSSWAQYTIRLESAEERDGLQKYLKDFDIPTMVYYPKPMHRQLAFAPYYCGQEELEVTERLCGRVLSLPFHPYMKHGEIKEVADRIREYKSSH